MTDEEITQSIAKAFDATVVPYWKLKHPPTYSELEESMASRSEGGGISPDLLQYAADVKARKYWKRRAVEICQRPRITKAEVYTAMEGVKRDKEMLNLLKQQLKRAK